MTQAERFLAAQRVGYQRYGFSSREARRIDRETAETAKDSK